MVNRLNILRKNNVFHKRNENLTRYFNEKLGGKLYGEKFQVEKWY